ncbi:universal stress protein [Niabella insulamsoli]|uniref:universal stress protein n=1 Tax=Niabella insulamsoli TaxID=3144874 RepID=UPI0031FE162D
MENIIAALDLQDQTELVVEKAMEMAEKFGSKLHLVHVVAPMGNYVATNIVDPLSGMETAVLPNELDLIEVHKNTAQERLDKIISGLPAGMVKAEVLIGAVEDEVINYAREQKAGMIVVGSHHRSGFARLLAGETSVRILHEAQIPILVIPTIENK